MGREGELWDDSALVKAFDQAMSKYKQKMHRKGYKENATDDAGASAEFDASQGDISNLETVDDGNSSGSHATVEVTEEENMGTAKGFEIADSQVSEEHGLGSSSFSLQDQPQNNSSSLDVDEYNQLYKQYYEVEEQRQKILQKMQNFSSCHYPYPSEGQWGSNFATQEYQSSITQVPCGTMVVSCCPCASQCPMASCSSLPCPSTGGCASTLSVDPPAIRSPGKQPTVEDVDIVKTAMGAAQRAISSLKIKTPDSKENKIYDGTEQSASSETDLSIVLNAWYSAGFYTGKYLTEQSLAKKQHH